MDPIQSETFQTAGQRKVAFIALWIYFKRQKNNKKNGENIEANLKLMLLICITTMTDSIYVYAFFPLLAKIIHSINYHWMTCSLSGSHIRHYTEYSLQ